MSAPDTNTKKQRRRHSVPIWGILLVVAFGVLVGGAITITGMSGDPTPEDVNTAASADGPVVGESDSERGPTVEEDGASALTGENSD